MGKITVKIAFSKENFREGLDYFIDKSGMLQKYTKDGEDCSGNIDTEFYIDNNVPKETMVLKIKKEYNRLLNGPLGDEKSSNRSYAYVYSEYGELQKIYVIYDDDDIDNELSIVGYDIRDLYRSCGLSDEAINEGERLLSIIAIRDGYQELREAKKQGKISSAVFVASVMLSLINHELAKIVGALTGSTSALSGALSINEMRKIKERIKHYHNKLQNGLEPDNMKQIDLRRDDEAYANAELASANIK